LMQFAIFQTKIKKQRKSQKNKKMKKYIELNKELYEIRDLNQLSINQYNMFTEILESGEEEKMIKMVLSYLTDLEEWQIDNIMLYDLFAMDWDLILNMELKNKKVKKKYIVDSKKYYLTKFEYLTFSQWIDIEYILKDQPDNIAFVITLLLNKEYDAEIIDELVKKFGDDIKIKDGYTLFNSYINWRESIYSKYSPLFKMAETTDDEEDEENDIDDVNEDAGWLKIAYSLCENDITKKKEILKMGIVEILNWMSIKKEEYDEQKDRNKNH